MRAFIRKEIDLESPIDIQKLKPFERILVAIKYQFRETKIYKYKKEKALEKDYRLKTEREERLKDSMLMYIYGELVKNNRFEASGKKCDRIVLSVSREVEDILEIVLKARDFLSFDIKILECDEDLLVAFPDLPILLEVHKKTL